MASQERSAVFSLIAVADNSSANLLAQAIWIVVFAGLTAIGAQVRIPHQPVPYTLQTFFVLLAGAFLGSRNGSFSQLLYLGVGLLGAPVFAGGGGPSLGPSGGYLLSFPIAAASIGYLLHKRRGFGWGLLSMFVGLLIIFACGATYLDLFYLHDASQAFVSGFFIFSWWDLLKLSAAAGIYNEFSRRYRKLPQDK